MNSNFKQLLDQFSEQWESVVQSSNLQEVESRFSDVEETRDDILNWVFDNIQNEEEQGSYFNTFGEVESNLAETLGDIPVFDDEFDIYESFDEYESYYQRYGCIVPEFVISWDDQRILWSDELQFIDYIQRPDVLMGGND
jgi:hypothetical protein